MRVPPSCQVNSIVPVAQQDGRAVMPRLVVARVRVLIGMLWRTVTSLVSPVRPSTGSGPPQLPEHVLCPVSLDTTHVRWLREIALKYNCGSMNKTLRDLLEFYTHVEIGELDEILRPESRQQPPLCRVRHFAEKVRESPPNVNSDGAYRPCISKVHSRWIQKTSNTYGLTPSLLLTRLIQFAISELDDELLFENISGMARSTADLYADITATKE
jgi:hypothetical protein